MEIEIESAEQFATEIKEGKVLVDFYAVWCGPCKMLSPLVSKLGEEHPELKVLKINVDVVPDVAAEYQIFSIPTLLLFEDGKMVKKNVGYVPESQLLHFAGF